MLKITKLSNFSKFMNFRKKVKGGSKKLTTIFLISYILVSLFTGSLTTKNMMKFSATRVGATYSKFNQCPQLFALSSELNDLNKSAKEFGIIGLSQIDDKGNQSVLSSSSPYFELCKKRSVYTSRYMNAVKSISNAIINLAAVKPIHNINIYEHCEVMGQKSQLCNSFANLARGLSQTTNLEDITGKTVRDLCEKRPKLLIGKGMASLAQLDLNNETLFSICNQQPELILCKESRLAEVSHMNQTDIGDLKEQQMRLQLAQETSSQQNQFPELLSKETAGKICHLENVASIGPCMLPHYPGTSYPIIRLSQEDSNTLLETLCTENKGLAIGSAIKGLGQTNTKTFMVSKFELSQICGMRPDLEVCDNFQNKKSINQVEFSLETVSGLCSVNKSLDIGSNFFSFAQNSNEVRGSNMVSYMKSHDEKSLAALQSTGNSDPTRFFCKSIELALFDREAIMDHCSKFSQIAAGKTFHLAQVEMSEEVEAYDKNLHRININTVIDVGKNKPTLAICANIKSLSETSFKLDSGILDKVGIEAPQIPLGGKSLSYFKIINVKDDNVTKLDQMKMKALAQSIPEIKPIAKADEKQKINFIEKIKAKVQEKISAPSDAKPKIVTDVKPKAISHIKQIVKSDEKIKDVLEAKKPKAVSETKSIIKTDEKKKVEERPKSFFGVKSNARSESNPKSNNEKPKETESKIEEIEKSVSEVKPKTIHDAKPKAEDKSKSIFDIKSTIKNPKAEESSKALIQENPKGTNQKPKEEDKQEEKLNLKPEDKPISTLEVKPKDTKSKSEEKSKDKVNVKPKSNIQVNSKQNPNAKIEENPKQTKPKAIKTESNSKAEPKLNAVAEKSKSKQNLTQGMFFTTEQAQGKNISASNPLGEMISKLAKEVSDNDQKSSDQTVSKVSKMTVNEYCEKNLKSKNCKDLRDFAFRNIMKLVPGGSGGAESKQVKFAQIETTEKRNGKSKIESADKTCSRNPKLSIGNSKAKVNSLAVQKSLNEYCLGNQINKSPLCQKILNNNSNLTELSKLVNEKEESNKEGLNFSNLASIESFCSKNTSDLYGNQIKSLANVIEFHGPILAQAGTHGPSGNTKLWEWYFYGEKQTSPFGDNIMNKTKVSLATLIEYSNRV